MAPSCDEMVDGVDKGMQRPNRRYAVLLVCAVAATRIAFRSHFLYDLDSVNFALALKRFDPSVHQPHPPGYFLYVLIGKLVDRLIQDPNSALVAISVAASCGAAWMIYLLTREWFGERPGMVSLALFLFSPLCWFHGTVALTYIVEAFFSALVGYWCWRTCAGDRRYAIPASIAIATAAGFRPSAALFLGPLWLYSILFEPGHKRLTRARNSIPPVLAACVATLAWFVPMIRAAGGWGAYFGPLAQLWNTVPGQRTVWHAPALVVARTVTIAWIIVLILGAAAPLLFYRGGPGKHLSTSGDGERRARIFRFSWIWMIPGLLFFSLVFLNYVNSGYLLVLSPPLFAVLSDRVYEFSAGRSLRVVALAVGMAANCALFFWAPFYFSYRSVRETGDQIARLQHDFRAGLDSASTLIIGFDAHFLGYRHAGYYLPEFTTVQYPEVAYPEGKRVFLMRGGVTAVCQHFSVSPFKTFVFFPLPAGAEYQEYLSGVLTKLPAGAVEVRELASSQVLTGSSTLVPRLFVTTATNSTGLYTRLSPCVSTVNDR